MREWHGWVLSSHPRVKRYSHGGGGGGGGVCVFVRVTARGSCVRAMVWVLGVCVCVRSIRTKISREQTCLILLFSSNTHPFHQLQHEMLMSLGFSSLL